jgi:hypothetical protein
MTYTADEVTEEEETMAKDKTADRPVPYERRAKRPGAGIVAPGARKPAGAMTWKKPTLYELARQGQLELFGGHPSVAPGVAEVKRLKKRRKRQKDQPGVVLHD